MTQNTMSTATIVSPNSVTFPASRMKKTKSIKPATNTEAAVDDASATSMPELPLDELPDVKVVHPPPEPAQPGENATETSGDPPAVSMPDPEVPPAAPEPAGKTVAKRDPSKPSSNFTTIERTFILMAIAAVRSDPKWRKHSTDTWSIKDFSIPFCNAVREKLNEDPDFKGRVAIATVTPDRDGKYRQSPSKESIRKIWSNLYLKGCLTRDPTNLGRKKDFAAEERVKQFIEQNQDATISSRAIAAHTNTSKRNVIRILHQEHLIVKTKGRLRKPGETPRKQVRRTPKKVSPSDGQND